MISSFLDVLPSLNKHGLCLPGFDTAGGQADFVMAALSACEEARCPALLLVWGPGATYIGLDACADLIKSLAKRFTVPVIMHLDHGTEEAMVVKCLDLGFRSVMFDGSRLPLEENIRRTREIAKVAHERGACIEGEIGMLGSEHGKTTVVGDLTDPATAAQFVRETGVDLVAPAVGNAHGFYRKPPQLDFERIAKIAELCKVPVSMHGGTGIPMGDLRRAASLGVRKLNVASILHRVFTDAVKATMVADDGKNHGAWRKGLDAGRAAVKQEVAGYMAELKLAESNLCPPAK